MVKRREKTVSGQLDIYGEISQGTAVSQRDDLLLSVNGRGSDHPFHSDHKQFSGSMLHNNEHTSSPRFNMYPSNWYNLDIPYLVLMEGHGSLMAKLLANSNPASPEFLLPNYLFELKDLPDMIRQGGRIAHALTTGTVNYRRYIRPGRIAQDMAAANLAIQFGWLPFINDLKSIVLLQSSIDKSRKKIEELQSGKGLYVSHKLGSITDNIEGDWPVWSGASLTVYANFKGVRTTESWGVARWKPNRSAANMPSSDADFRRRVLGLSLDNVPLNVWESLPWSWLVDYFVNVGNLLKANNRSIATPVSGCVMIKSQVTVEHAGKDIGSWADPPNARILTPGSARFWNHRRYTIAEAGLEPSNFQSFFRVMNPKQLSILSSLATARALGRGR